MKRPLLLSTMLLMLPGMALSQFHAAGPVGGSIILVGSSGGHSGGGGAANIPPPPPPPPHIGPRYHKLVCKWHRNGHRRWKTCKRG